MISHQYRAVIVLVSLALVILLPLVLLLLSSPYSQYCKGQGVMVMEIEVYFPRGHYSNRIPKDTCTIGGVMGVQGTRDNRVLNTRS